MVTGLATRCLRWSLARAALFALSAFVFLQAGLEGRLTTDDAFYFYSGRRLAEGVPPYVSGFDNKGPGAPAVNAAVVTAAKWLGVKPLYAARVVYLAASCLTVVGIYELILPLVASAWLAWIASFLTTTFSAFGLFATTGPSPYTLVALDVSWSLAFLARRNYGLAALCGTASGLVWQPTLFYGLFPLVLALLATGSRRERAGRVLRGAAGFVLPIAGVAACFVYANALNYLVEEALVYNTMHLERPTPMYYNPWWIVRAVILGFPEASGLIVLGLLALPLVAYARTRAVGWGGLFGSDPWRGVVLSAPVPVVWSFLDFQTRGDFFVFIPYAVVGFAWLLETAARGVRQVFPAAAWRAVPVGIAVLIAAYSATIYRLRGTADLIAQQKLTDDIVRIYGADTNILAVHAPEFLVLSNRTTSVPLLANVPPGGLSAMIADSYANGFDGLIADIEAAPPKVVVVGLIEGKGLGPVETWLNENFTTRQMGPWRVYVRP